MKRGEILRRSVRAREALEAKLRKALAFRRKRTKKIARDARTRTYTSAKLRRSRALLRKVFAATKLAHRKSVVARVRLENYRRKLRLSRNVGARAANWLMKYQGRTEDPAGSNDSPFLAAWRAELPSLAWMKGQPWCGFAVRAAYHYNGKDLPDAVVYTPSIVALANAGQGFTRVDPYKAKRGDLVVFDFDGGGADHVGLALGPAKAGSIPTVEGNTSPGDSGSQSNGGGVFHRLRPLNVVAVVARPK